MDHFPTIEDFRRAARADHDRWANTRAPQTPAPSSEPQVGSEVVETSSDRFDDTSYHIYAPDDFPM